MRNTPIDMLEGTAVPILRPNIDTDAIFPSRSKARVDQANYAEFLFGEWRYNSDGQPRQDFALNDPARQGAPFLLALENFGCGSSRETAVWALRDHGIRCVIAPSFGSIFRGNCFQNGVVPVSLSHEMVRQIGAQVEADPTLRLRMNLEEQTVALGDATPLSFDLPLGPKRMLLLGLDPIGLTLTRREAIGGFRSQDRLDRPWAYIQ